MITKQQQLEWLAKKYKTWPEQGATSLGLSVTEVGKFAVVNCYLITRQEWQQERGKMQKQLAQSVQSKPDNSWYERGELPPVGVPVELWFGGSFAFNCEFITRRRHHYVMWNLDADRPDAADNLNSEFRPIRTEREKAIDEMYQAAFSIGSKINAETIGAIYDAGYRKVKP